MNPESMLKGRMAETLVEELLKHSGNIVYRFGYEAIVQNLVQLENSFDRNSEVGERIRAIPDFIVINKTGNPMFLEVKFRWNSELGKDDLARLERVNRFWNARVVFVSCREKPYFRVSEPPYINEKSELTLKPLLDINEWKIDKNVYEEYEQLVHRYLTPTLVPPKK